MANRYAVIDEDFEESDVWAAVKNEREDPSSKIMRNFKDYFGSSSSSSSSSAWTKPTAPRKVPRANNPSSHGAKVVQQSSVPVEIPDWSKIYGKKSSKGSRDGSHSLEGGETSDCVAYHDDEDDDDGGEDEEMVPPHEWIARKLARNQISSFSVCEGVGRTLKGRDLRKVRNAILTKTGFLE
ncbi:protein S40-7-like [Malania oleifera]|uniref:protein S40-7-like n=1 Tax=Malania oleifera TaxID=397392 RepID=UPI0025ADBB9E|nr:protein S40-7-like [Malania oleifera]XP_057960629.1 protein S40-7-like [Malania oleifera]